MFLTCPVPWWNEFYEKYKKYLEEYSPGTRFGSYSIESFEIFYDELREFLEDKGMELSNQRANHYLNSDIAYSAESNEGYQKRGTYNPDEEKAYSIEKIIEENSFEKLPSKKLKWR